jgi:hypothetical protein
MKPSVKKRTGVLKELMSQDGKAVGNSLLQLKEDLLDSDQPEPMAEIKNPHSCGSHIIQIPSNKHQDQIDSKALLNKPDLSQSIALFERLIKKELESTAIKLGIESEELQAWINVQIEVPAKTIMSLLRTSKETGLDPLREEIGFVQYEDSNWQVYITVDGAIKLLNRHEAFDGITFNQSENLIEGIPEWIECTIYRKDKSFPTTAREYYLEARSEQSIWQKMPRRMLRNRALKECVRLSFSVNNIRPLTNS